MRFRDYYKMSMINKDQTWYLVVIESYWSEYRFNAYVDRECVNLEEAKYVAKAIEDCDHMSTVIIIVKGGKFNVKYW